MCGFLLLQIMKYMRKIEPHCEIVLILQLRSKCFSAGLSVFE